MQLAPSACSAAGNDVECGNKLGHLLERHRSVALRPPVTVGGAPKRAEVVTMEASRWVRLAEVGGGVAAGRFDNHR